MSNISKLTLLGAAGAGGGGPFWIALLGGTGPDESRSVATDSSNNVIIAGMTSPDGAYGNNFLLVAKYDLDGALLWDKILGKSGSFDQGSGVAVDSADNIIVCGSTASVGAGDDDVLVAKYNSSGTLQWDRTLGGNSADQGLDVAIDSSDNIIVSGNCLSDGQGSFDFLIAKYNSSGTLQWDRTLGSSSTERGNSVAIDSADNIIVCGESDGVGAGSNDLLVAKYNSSGTIQWQKSLGGTSADTGTGVAIDSADNIIVCGSTDSAGAGGSDLLVAKYNSSGVIQWQKILGGTGSDIPGKVAVDSSDNIVVCAYTTSAGAGSLDYLIAKYNSSGTLQWDKTLGGTGFDQGMSVTVDSANNVIVCGRTQSDGEGSYECMIAKLPSDGSGDGTYGVFVYQDASLTAATSSLTSASSSATDAPAVLTSAAASLTSADASLTSELFPI
tara:strand:- start:505 stop:1833 length:1329 start_codon:yes stop_codon:yes gene_type:complete